MPWAEVMSFRLSNQIFSGSTFSMRPQNSHLRWSSKASMPITTTHGMLPTVRIECTRRLENGGQQSLLQARKARRNKCLAEPVTSTLGIEYLKLDVLSALQPVDEFRKFCYQSSRGYLGLKKDMHLVSAPLTMNSPPHALLLILAAGIWWYFRFDYGKDPPRRRQRLPYEHRQ